jgi:hypothetical protein
VGRGLRAAIRPAADRVLAAGAGSRLRTGRDAARDHLRRSARTRRADGHETRCSPASVASRLKPSRSPGFPGRGAAPAFSPARRLSGPLPPALLALRAGAARRTAAARIASGRAAADPPPLAAHARRLPPGANRRMVAAALRARQALHAADAAARPGPGGAGNALAAAARRLSTTCAKCWRSAGEPALVLLGPPGCGKSTLLRRLELDLAADALRTAAGEASPLSFFVPLNRYRPARPGEALPAAGRLAGAGMGATHPATAGIRRTAAERSARPAARRGQRAAARRRSRLPRAHRLWRDFLGELPAGTRVLFSCRSLDYSASLSTPEAPVPHVRIEQLGDAQVAEFLDALRRRTWPGALAATARNAAARPLPLAVLPAPAARPGRRGWRGAERQGRAVHRLRPPGAAARDRRRQPAVSPRRAARQARPRTHHPPRMAQRDRPAILAPLLPALVPARLRAAGAARTRRSVAGARAVRRRARTARRRGSSTAKICCTPASRCRCSKCSGTTSSTSINCCRSILPRVRWRPRRSPNWPPAPGAPTRCSPTSTEVLAGLADSDPLPEAPTTGWEETFVLAAAMARARGLRRAR